MNDEEVRNALEDWIKTRPRSVQKVIRKYSPLACYHSTLNKRGHYIIHSYDRDEKDNITVQVLHGADSFLPGFLVFGVSPSTLLKCGCDDFAFASRPQANAAKEYFNFIKRRQEPKTESKLPEGMQPCEQCIYYDFDPQKVKSCKICEGNGYVKCEHAGYDNGICVRCGSKF